MKQFILFMALLNITGNMTCLNAQDPVTEGLENLLQLHAEMDTSRVNLLNITALKLYQVDSERSLSYAREAKELATGLSYKKGEAESLRLIGLYYFIHSDYRQALEFTNNSLDLAGELGLLDLQKNTYSQLSDIYAAMKDYRMAYQSHLLYKKLNDSIFSQQEVAKFTGLEQQYRYEREKQTIESDQQRKDLIHAEEIKRQKVIRNSFIIGFVLMALLLFVILNSYLQNRKANRVLADQKKEIENQTNKMKDSIEAAQRIQRALFPLKETIEEILPEHFIFNRPRDVVSGDYYWLTEKEGEAILAVADCTGHGVPGAFMSMLGIAYMNEIVNRTKIPRADEILFQLREEVIGSLHQRGEKYEQRDGIDISLCIFDFKNLKMQFAGAFSQLYLIRNQELIELKGDKMPIGISVRKDQLFTNTEMELKRDDRIYLCTDGYSDQIGGPKRKTFRSKYLKELLLRIHENSMTEQEDILEKTLEEWRGEIEQIDDILILGIRV